jgi:hypothetical protein
MDYSILVLSMDDGGEVLPVRRPLRLLWLLPLPMALLLRLFAEANPAATERLFSRGVYPFLAAPISRATGLLPVPVIEIALVVFIVFLIFSLFQRRFFRVLVALGLAGTVFLGGWSLNYFRLPLSQTLGLTLMPSEPGELAALCEALITEANERHCEEPEGDLFAPVEAALNAAAQTWPIPAGRWGAPKIALSSPLLSRLMTAGITSPFTAEALVVGGAPVHSLPYVACHEAAHVRGFAREEDANFIAYLACEASDVPYYRYSGTLGVLRYCLNALAGADADAHSACVAQLSDDVRQDFAEYAAYWEPYQRGTAAQVGRQVNDAYLQAVASGDQSARSYGRVVDLLLALHRESRGIL